MLTAKEILDALTYDGNIEVDGDEAIRIVNRLTELQLQKLQQSGVKRSLPLVEALEEYNGVLVEELNELVGIAAVHGWRSSRVDIGQQMRNRIAELKRQ